ncbi:MAG: M23 family metallopeptidase [Melioribacteraceae bacterium]|nr:M23 family metallopeptidase [Melioribacteraceae bacterium]
MKILFLFITIFTLTLSSQELQLLGTTQPGNAMIGKAPDIQQVIFNDKKIQVDKNGTFIFGFDRDAKGTHVLKVKYDNGKSEIKRFTLPEREYDIQRITSSKQQFSSPPKEELARIKRERQQMREARSKVGKIDTAYFSSGFTRPIKGGRVVGVYGSQRILNDVPKNIHNGIDIAAPTGTDVYAMADGVVQIAGDNFYYNGTFVLIDHGQGLSSVYLHFSKSVVEDRRLCKERSKDR